MATQIDETFLFGVVALGIDKITQDEFIRAAADVHSKGGTIRERLIETCKLPQDTISVIDTAVEFQQPMTAGSVRGERSTDRVANRRTTGSIEDSLSKAFGQTRYDLQGELGRGGLGVVKKVYDNATERSIAYKTLRVPGKRTDALNIEQIDAEDLKRFREEAMVCAQLEHPNIVPVYEIGTDVRDIPFYTMRAIGGKTLTMAIVEYHNHRLRLKMRDKAPTKEELDDLSLRRSRLYHCFADACKAIAYAHSKKVIHRDLKSDNIMVGSYGETILLDWGIAKVKNESTAKETQSVPNRDELRAKITTIRHQSSFKTIDGAIMGTPSYMPPEQAAGRAGEIDESSDIYSLGAILYEILVGTPPFTSDDLFTTLDLVLYAPTIPPAVHLAMRDVAALKGEPLESCHYTIADVPKDQTLPLDLIAVPQGISKIVMKALSKKQRNRYGSAKELYDEILNFLEGSKHQQQQRELSTDALLEANEAIAAYRAAQARVLELEVEEAAMRASVKPYAPVSEKQSLWKLEDTLRKVRHQATSGYSKCVELLSKATGYDNTNADARAASARFFWEHLLEAEAKGDGLRAKFCATQVRLFDDGSYVNGLKGDGMLSLATDDPNADIYCFRYYDDGRKSVPVPLELWDLRETCIPQENPDGTIDIGNELSIDFAHIGKGKIEDLRLEMGSYLIFIRRENADDIRLPILIERSEDLRLEVNLAGSLQVVPGFVYIPSSRFAFGGDPRSNNAHREIRENKAFAIARFPVTAGEYLEFLNGLDPADAEARRPREGYTAKSLWPNDGQRYALPEDWHVDAPVVGVSWDDAQAYAAWLSERDQKIYALPTETQWEHAARGADGRFFPWGNAVDATFLNAAGSREEGNGLVSVDTYPIDESPFGVRGMGGNVRDWCQDTPGSRRTDMRIVRGGFWSNPAGYARSASRPAMHQLDVSWEVGFRLVQVLSTDE